MKEISQKLTRQWCQRQHVEKKLNNLLLKNIGKAVPGVCLFLCAGISLSAQSFSFNETEKDLYDKTLNLEFANVFDQAKEPSSPQEQYILSLTRTLELLIFEDEKKFKSYENAFDKINDLPGKTATEQFLKAESRLQWAFVCLKFGHEFDAAFNLRQAYQLTAECKKRYPDFIPILKTSGLLNIMIGAVPDKYDWLLGLLGVDGSIEGGINELTRVVDSNSSLSAEAELLLGLANGFIFQKPENGLSYIERLKNSHDHRLLNFFGGSLAIKNSQSELALKYLHPFTKTEAVGTLPYAQYLLGEIYLHKADYPQAIKHYENFRNKYKGVNYIKDAYFKTAVCYLLNGNPSHAEKLFQAARSNGKEIVEADIYAAKALEENKPPHVELSKARYATDGGYYADAEKILDNLKATELSRKKDKVEYYYRKARVAHKQNKIEPAILFYNQVISSTAEDDHWYYAPNAALQLGYIKLGSGNDEEAREHFQKALSYKRHEYKNSIDSKARSALAQIRAK
jgi:tetratricopeptide (TPR) repeat protein